MKKIEIVLLHIKEDCQEILEFIKGFDEAKFNEDHLVQKAVCMSLINIGELVKTLPKDFRDDNPTIPWKRIAGMRDLAAHKYHQLDFSAIWNVAINRIPELTKFIDTYFKEKQS